MHTTTPIQRAQRAAAFVVAYIVMPLIAFLMAVGGRVALLLQAMALFQATNVAFADGVSPASMGTVDLPQSQVIAYDKSFIENLKGETPWVRTTSRRTLEQNSGNQLRLYMYQNMGANPTQAAEGTVGSGIKATVLSNTSTIGQYADYLNLSDLSMQTSIDPVLTNVSKLLGYRLAQTLNVIVQNTADGAAAVDSSVNAHSKAWNVPIATTDITTNVQSLAGRNVQPFESGFYAGIVHPFIVGDFINDNANNGITDVLKRTAEGAAKLRELPVSGGDNVSVIEWGGVKFHASTFVKQTPNYQNHGVTALRTYINGMDGVITISLGAKDNTAIGDGDWRNLQMWVKTITDPSGYDPSRMIGGFASYNTKMTATLPPDPVQRIRIIDAVPVVS